MNYYAYDGPVMAFDSCVVHRWKSQTKATSENKARCNLTYQWKKKNKLAPNAKITLPGKIVMVQ